MGIGPAQRDACQLATPAPRWPSPRSPGPQTGAGGPKARSQNFRKSISKLAQFVQSTGQTSGAAIAFQSKLIMRSTHTTCNAWGGGQLPANTAGLTATLRASPGLARRPGCRDSR